VVVVQRPVPVSRAEPRLSGRQVRRSLAAGAIHGALIAGLALIFFPIAWAASTSLKNPGDIFLFPPTWIPNPIRWQNYVEAMTKADFGRYFLNTAFLSCSIVAFAFARLRWWAATCCSW
jgi:multiple sugar transport system permease protein